MEKVERPRQTTAELAKYREERRLLLNKIKSDTTLRSNLLAAIDVLICFFSDFEREMKNVFLWRMEHPPEFRETKKLWHELLKEETYHEELVQINGWDMYHPSRKYVTYAVTGEDATLKNWKKLENLSKSAKKALWIEPFSNSKSVKDLFHDSLFLRAFTEDVRGSQLILHSYHWFEVIFVAADAKTCPIRSTMVFAQVDDKDKHRLSVSCRKIDDDYCRANITALRLFRHIAEEEMGSKTELVQIKRAPILNEAEQNIIEALNTSTLTGGELAKKAGYPYNSNFKSTLAGLRKRGILGNKSPGYFLEAEYHFILNKSD